VRPEQKGQTRAFFNRGRSENRHGLQIRHAPKNQRGNQNMCQGKTNQIELEEDCSGAFCSSNEARRVKPRTPSAHVYGKRGGHTSVRNWRTEPLGAKETMAADKVGESTKHKQTRTSATVPPREDLQAQGVFGIGRRTKSTESSKVKLVPDQGESRNGMVRDCGGS